MDSPSTTVPLELRIKVAVLARPFLALLWLGSWLRFISVALDIGSAGARVDRRLWLHEITVMMLDEMQKAAQQGIYPIRVIRAALAPYYPKEESRP